MYVCLSIFSTDLLPTTPHHLHPRKRLSGDAGFSVTQVNLSAIGLSNCSRAALFQLAQDDQDLVVLLFCCSITIQTNLAIWNHINRVSYCAKDVLLEIGPWFVTVGHQNPALDPGITKPGTMPSCVSSCVACPLITWVPQSWWHVLTPCRTSQKCRNKMSNRLLLVIL